METILKMTTQTKIKNNVLFFTILFIVMLSNNSTPFILVSWYFIVLPIYNPWILSLLRKLGIITVFNFGSWKSCICTCQTKKSIILIVKEASKSCCLGCVGHQIQLDSTNVTLGLIHIPIDLVCISMLVSCFCRLDIHV